MYADTDNIGPLRIENNEGPRRKGLAVVARNPDASTNLKSLRTCGIGSGLLQKARPRCHVAGTRGAQPHDSGDAPKNLSLR